MRIGRVPISALALILVFQGAVAVLPHDHGWSKAAAGDAILTPSAEDGHRACLACTSHAPAAVAAAATTALDSARVEVVAGGADGGDAVLSESSAFDPRGPPQVV
ncbi:MAG: hypothetical protein MUC56_11700 [Thermoanaerobaculales bacterium]|jgi:hypothetical protein|nr:hypothetical protein [Thermoanaerobaculales bacterium]